MLGVTSVAVFRIGGLLIAAGVVVVAFFVTGRLSRLPPDGSPIKIARMTVRNGAMVMVVGVLLALLDNQLAKVVGAAAASLGLIVMVTGFYLLSRKP
jgi:hypothetical protein